METRAGRAPRDAVTKADLIDVERRTLWQQRHLARLPDGPGVTGDAAHLPVAEQHVFQRGHGVGRGDRVSRAPAAHRDALDRALLDLDQQIPGAQGVHAPHRRQKGIAALRVVHLQALAQLRGIELGEEGHAGRRRIDAGNDERRRGGVQGVPELRVAAGTRPAGAFGVDGEGFLATGLQQAQTDRKRQPGPVASADQVRTPDAGQLGERTPLGWPIAHNAAARWRIDDLPGATRALGRLRAGPRQVLTEHAIAPVATLEARLQQERVADRIGHQGLRVGAKRLARQLLSARFHTIVSLLRRFNP